MSEDDEATGCIFGAIGICFIGSLCLFICAGGLGSAVAVFRWITR